VRFDTTAWLWTAAAPIRLHLSTARTPWQRFSGLMGRRPLQLQAASAEALLLPDCTSVHGCFVREALDLLYLDDAGCVTQTARLRCFGWSIGATRAGLRPRHVLELPSGAVKRLAIGVGDRLQIAGPSAEAAP
jgi:uncharacterized protein